MNNLENLDFTILKDKSIPYGDKSSEKIDLTTYIHPVLYQDAEKAGLIKNGELTEKFQKTLARILK